MAARIANPRVDRARQDAVRPGKLLVPRLMAQLSDANSARASFDRPFREQLAKLTRSTFISFARVQDSISIWAADNRGMQFQVSPQSFSVVSQETAQLLNLLTTAHSSSVAIGQIAKRLYSALFAPVAGFLEDSRGLTVHFGGDLRSVPLPLLQTPDGECLLERFSFVHATDFPWQSGRTPIDSIPADAKVLIVEAPAPAGKAEKRRSDASDCAPDDLLFIAGALPYNDMICDSAATRVQFNRLAPQAEVLHCRALVSSGVHGPQLHLAPQSSSPPSPSLADEGLQPLKGYRHQAFPNCILGVFDVDFVTRRQSDSPDLWHGASLAMHYAGIRNVIIPRWNAPAEARREFHQVFYSRLKTGSTIGESFEQARRNLRAQSKWRHPHHWAGFTHSITHL